VARYETRILSSAREVASMAGAWERLRQQQERPHIAQHPDWLAIEGRAAPGGAPIVVAVYDGDELIGVAPFLLRRWPWACMIGYVTLMRFPMRVASLGGETLLARADREAEEALIHAMLTTATPCDMIFLDNVPLESSLWRLVQDSPLIRGRFWIYTPGKVAPHWLIDMPESFQAYLAGFSGRTRRKLQYAVRKLDATCEGRLRVQRITRREQVPELLEQVARVSAQSWQGTRMGLVIRPTPEEGERLGAYADRGWLRCYLLKHGDEALAFVLGRQADGVYYYDRVGYLPGWSDYSPGKVLLYRLIEDLFDADTPTWLNFGSDDSEYKRLFGNHAYDDRSVYLVRRSAYATLAYATHALCRAAGAATLRTLDRLHLKERARQLVRGRPGVRAHQR
jgi:hypothetical protein